MKAEQDQSQADGLNLIEQLIMDSFTRLDGEKGLPLLLYSLLSGEINLPKPDSLQESQLEELENAEAARKILAKLPQELLLKKETIELIDSVFSEIETALVKARKMLQSLPENLWSEQPLEAPDFTPRQRAGEGVQNISGRQTAIEYLPKKINQIEMWSFLTVVRAMFKNETQVALLLKQIHSVLDLMSSRHFADNRSNFQTLFEDIAKIMDFDSLTPLSFQNLVTFLDELIRYNEHIDEIIPDGTELDLLRRLATLVHTKNLQLQTSGKTLSLSSAGLLPHQVVMLFADTLKSELVPPPGIEPGFSA